MDAARVNGQMTTRPFEYAAGLMTTSSSLARSFASALILTLASASLFACDDPKDGSKPAASASVKPTATVPPVATTAPAASAPAAVPAPAKREFKCEPGEAVTFNSPALEQEVRRKSGKDAGAITKADIAKVKSINLTQSPTDFLDPCVFPLLTNVKDIFLGQGDLEDLKPVEGLTQLISLRASINKVKDIKPLSRMTKLDRLDLARTLVEDIAPIGNMTELTELALDDSPVTDLSALAKCVKLERLSIKNTRVTDLKPLQGLRKLKVLSIQGSPITDTNVLAAQRSSGLKIETK